MEWLVSKSISLVLCDATPLSCIAGKTAGAKVILVTNFTWDFCYREMLRTVIADGRCSPEMLIEYQEMVDQCSKDTCMCDLYLQYPGKTQLPLGFNGKVVDGPLIARCPRNHGLRQELGFASNEKVLLLGFGGHDMAWSFNDNFLPSGWSCCVLGAKPSQIMPSDRWHALSYDCHVPDLIHMADAVLGKLGYGFVSECLSAGTALVFVPRIDWPEEHFLEKLLCDEYNAGVRMPIEDFISGNWTRYLDDASSLKNAWTVDPAIDSKVAVDKILSSLSEVMGVSKKPSCEL